MKYLIFISIALVSCVKNDCEEFIVNVNIGTEITATNDGILTVTNTTDCDAQIEIYNRLILTNDKENQDIEIYKNERYIVRQLERADYNPITGTTIFYQCNSSIEATFKTVCDGK